MEGTDRKPRGLVQHPSFSDQLGRVSSKHQSQISRKTLDLTRDPLPGGSKTALVAYTGLYRVRAGDFRIIYTYNETVVHVLTLRQRDEDTYDDLDQFEQEQLEEFRAIGGRKAPRHSIPAWEELAKKWAAPKPKFDELLPHPITLAMLEQLGVSAEFREALLKATTANALLDLQEVPFAVREAVLERICPKRTNLAGDPPTPVVVLSDLIDPVAAETSGPIDASPPAERAGVSAHDAKARPKSVLRETSKTPNRVPTPAPLVVTIARRQEPLKPYRGNISKGIGKETRYTVKLDGTIQLLYGVGRNERALLTTDGHPVVDLVNQAKRFGGGSQGGGGFLINEFRHVLVPLPSGEDVLYAGSYTRDLEFEFENTLISPVAPQSIRPGDAWPGPHVGIKYTLSAGAKDVRYDAQTSRGTIRRVSLTDHHSAEELGDLLHMFRRVKPNGGAIYVNEARELFAPVDDGSGYERRYIGHLGGKPWFESPD